MYKIYFSVILNIYISIFIQFIHSIIIVRQQFFKCFWVNTADSFSLGDYPPTRSQKFVL